jgi:uncharacterized protein (TIGR03437 family)
MLLVLCAAGRAATTNTTLTVNAIATISGANYVVTGSASLTGIGNGSIDSTLSAPVNPSLVAGFTITLPGGTLVGTLTFGTLISSAKASATITGGTGAYAGDTGSFSLTGNAGFTTIASDLILSCSGSGTITGGGPVLPAITAVEDAGSYTSNVAQGGIFVVKGTNLSAGGYAQLAFPLPTSSGGTSITFTPASGGTAVQAYLLYTYNQGGVNQLAAVLPSTVAAGNYNVTVTYNGAISSPFLTQVVASKPGLLTQDATGNGMAVLQNIISATQYDLNRLTTGDIGGVTYSPAKPGQTLVVYATGLGPVPGGDNVASAAYDFTKNGVTVSVLVGGNVLLPALYAGRAPGFAGLDQIAFTLPTSISSGCAVSLQIFVNRIASAPTTLSIAPSPSDTACVLPGFTPDQLDALDQGGGYYITGGFAIEHIVESFVGTNPIKEDSAYGSFNQLSGFELGSLPTEAVALASNAPGTCTVYQSTGVQPQILGDGGTPLDAGVITLTGPDGTQLSKTSMTETGNTYLLGIGGTGITAGTYTLAGAGGKDVGKFSASTTVGTPVTIAGGLPSVVTESEGLTLNWTGGNSSDLVEIIGSSWIDTGTGYNLATSTTFVCTATAGQGTFTVPPAVLTQLQKVSVLAGFLEVASTPAPALFTAPLTTGGTVTGSFLGLQGALSQVAYQ